jgi:hypothetical protein
MATHDRAPSHDGGSMWFILAVGFVALCETGRGQLGGCGEYWMGRLRVVRCQIQSFKVVALTYVY